MAEVTREELAAMTDQELLAYEREHHGDPYMTLLRAKGLQRVALQFWHVGAARDKADRETRAEARRWWARPSGLGRAIDDQDALGTCRTQRMLCQLAAM